MSANDAFPSRPQLNLLKGIADGGGFTLTLDRRPVMYHRFVSKTDSERLYFSPDKMQVHVMMLALEACMHWKNENLLGDYEPLAKKLHRQLEEAADNAGWIPDDDPTAGY